ncbi:MAG: ribosome small subunit-dependent GTPase A [Clostridiaceae bacterium]|nr:ribosome small subunit-dependent GTPase A [Clostridiaceae bacterium]
MKGTIIKGIGGFYYVKTEKEVIECKARGKFRFNELTPMVGDNVEIDVVNNKGSIEKILQRTTELVRPAVANVTQAFIIFAMKDPEINEDLLNKFLISCEYNKLRVVICFNKKDLVGEEQNEVISNLKKIHYDIITLQAKGEEDFSEMKLRLKDNITVFCGPSGVGKSTILNKLVGREVMQTGEISERLQRGKHTTRHSELIEIEGGFVVDTPGFSILDIDFIPKDQLQYCFPEFDQYRDECKYRGCLHSKEPKCAVKQAVEKSEINIKRFQFYTKLIDEYKDRRY